MSVVRHLSELGLAVLLAATPAAADTVITADEVICCWDVRPAAGDSVCFTLPRLELRTLSALDVYEVRLADSGRVAALSSRLPHLRVVLDAGQPIPAPAARALQMEVTWDSVWCAGPLHAASQSATPDEMVAKCREMYVVLLEYGRSNDTIAVLLRDVEREEQALRRIWPSVAARCVPGVLGSVPLGILGAAIYMNAWAASRTSSYDIGLLGPCLVGCGLGGAVGTTLGVILGADARRRTIVAHRERVNTLVRRVNRAVATTP